MLDVAVVPYDNGRYHVHDKVCIVTLQISSLVLQRSVMYGRGMCRYGLFGADSPDTDTVCKCPICWW